MQAARKTRRRGWISSAPFALAVALAVSAHAEPAVAQGTADTAASAQSALAAMQVQLQKTQAAIDRVNHLLDSMPQELTDLDALGRSLHSPQAAFAFVRDEIAYEPYRGIEKGAWGTLLTRGGNDLDKSLLLVALLENQSVDAEIVHGKLDAATVRQLAAQSATQPDAVSLALAALTVPAAVAASSPDEEASVERFDAAVKERRTSLQATVDGAYKALAVVAPAAATGVPAPTADHYWVQAQIDGKTVDFDPSLTGDEPGMNPTTTDGSYEPNDLPAKLYQTLRFRLIAGYLQDGKLVPQTVLDKTVRAADILGKPLRLAISPKSDDGGASDFLAQLRVGDDTTNGEVFRLHLPAEKAQSDDGGGGMLGGLAAFGGGSAPPSPATKGAPLARLVFVLTETAPGEAPFTVRRTVLDRLDGAGDALAANQPDVLARRLLVQIWDGAADAGAFAAPFVFRTQNNELAAIRDGAAAALDATRRGKQFSQDSFPHPVLSSAIVDLFFASDLARHFIGKGIGPRTRSFYRMPRLAFMRRGFRVGDWGTTRLRAVYAEDIDLLDSPLVFTGSGPADVRQFALRSGITDTALEVQAGSTQARIGTLAVFAALPAGAAAKRYTQTAALPDDLPSPILAALRADVTAGNVVVAPASLVDLDGTRTYGWWSFSPGTSYALGKMVLGGGQALTEYQIAAHQVLLYLPYISALANCTGCVLQAGTLDVSSMDSRTQQQYDDCMVGAICSFATALIFQLTGGLAPASLIEPELATLMKLGAAYVKLGVGMGAGRVCKSL